MRLASFKKPLLYHKVLQQETVIYSMRTSLGFRVNFLTKNPPTLRGCVCEYVCRPRILEGSIPPDTTPTDCSYPPLYVAPPLISKYTPLPPLVWYSSLLFIPWPCSRFGPSFSGIDFGATRDRQHMRTYVALRNGTRKIELVLRDAGARSAFHWLRSLKNFYLENTPHLYWSSG